MVAKRPFSRHRGMHQHAIRGCHPRPLAARAADGSGCEQPAVSPPSPRFCRNPQIRTGPKHRLDTTYRHGRLPTPVPISPPPGRHASPPTTNARKRDSNATRHTTKTRTTADRRRRAHCQRGRRAPARARHDSRRLGTARHPALPEDRTPPHLHPPRHRSGPDRLGLTTMTRRAREPSAASARSARHPGKARPSSASKKPAPRSEPLPADYPRFLEEAKRAVSVARSQAALAVSAAVLAAYWEIGAGILAQEGHEGWGAKVIDRLGASTPSTKSSVSTTTRPRSASCSAQDATRQ
jgi:hypothetical protein